MPAEGQHTDVSDDTAFHTLEVMISLSFSIASDFLLTYESIQMHWKKFQSLQMNLLKSQKVP